MQHCSRDPFAQPWIRKLHEVALGVHYLASIRFVAVVGLPYLDDLDVVVHDNEVRGASRSVGEATRQCGHDDIEMLKYSTPRERATYLARAQAQAHMEMNL
jgi:hypothetical protein